jgi:molybdopterin molybdotransferase
METARTAKDEEVCGAGAIGTVIPADIAAAKALAVARPIRETERLVLAESVGRVAAYPIDARIDLPPFNNSAMDGYAVRTRELAGAGLWVLKVAARIAAGDAVGPFEARANSALRIFTGAPMPDGFDAVVMQEHCSREGDLVVVGKRPRSGENVRSAGEDVRAGDRLIEPGALMTAQRIALAAAQGLAEVDVIRKVRIGMISTGSELREPGEELAPGQIYNSNRIMLRSILAGHEWAELLDYGIVADRRDALAGTIGDATKSCDVVIASGGVSAGEEDHVVGALSDHGAELDILKVAMRPGKPVKVGLIGDVLFVGLPGNPNAALVTFHQIALPAIRARAGLAPSPSQWQPAVAGFSYRKNVGRTEFVPVRVMRRDDLGRPMLEMLSRGSSASLLAMALADGIAVLPPDVGTIEAGLPLRYEPFCRC